MIKTTVSRRAFALAGALVAARGGVIKPQQGFAQTPTPGPYTTPEPPPDATVTPSTLAVQDAYTFVVAGLDTRGTAQDENTDVMMLSRVEIANRRVRTLSIPRDLYADIPGYGMLKINGAYNLAAKANNHDWNAGAELFRQTIEWNFNFKVDGVVTTNLHKMPGVIDAMGGITVINPYDVVDETYPTPDFGVKPLYFPAGELRLTGEEALEFSRTRHMDFDEGRVMRQQLVLTAALAELQRPASLARLPQIVDAGREFVMTDIPADVQGQLVAAIPDIDPDLVAWGTVTDQLQGETLPNGGWVYTADWTTLPVHVRGWLGVGYLDANRW